MNNTTISLHNDDDDIVAWIVVPVILGTLFYMTVALFVWPYARPIVTPWLLILCILLPPLFPFLLFFIVFSVRLLTQGPFFLVFHCFF